MEQNNGNKNKRIRKSTETAKRNEKKITKETNKKWTRRKFAVITQKRWY